MLKTMFILFICSAQLVFADNLAGSSGPVSLQTGCRTADPDFPGFGKTLHLVGGTLSFSEGQKAEYKNPRWSDCSGSYTLRDERDGSEPVVMLKINLSCRNGKSFFVDIMTPPSTTRSPKLKGRFFAAERSFFMESSIDRAVGCAANHYKALHVLETM